MRSIYISVLALLTGCTSMQPLNHELTRTEIVESISIDQPLLIQTTDAERFVLVVKKINKDAIIGIEKEVQFQDIQEINTEQFSIIKTAGAAVAVSVVASFVVLLSFLDDL